MCWPGSQNEAKLLAAVQARILILPQEKIWTAAQGPWNQVPGKSHPWKELCWRHFPPFSKSCPTPLKRSQLTLTWIGHCRDSAHNPKGWPSLPTVILHQYSSNPSRLVPGSKTCQNPEERTMWRWTLSQQSKHVLGLLSASWFSTPQLFTSETEKRGVARKGADTEMGQTGYLLKTRAWLKWI